MGTDFRFHIETDDIRFEEEKEMDGQFDIFMKEVFGLAETLFNKEFRSKSNLYLCRKMIFDAEKDTIDVYIRKVPRPLVPVS